MLDTVQSLLDFSTNLAVLVYKCSNSLLVAISLQYKNIVSEVRDSLLHLVKVDTKESALWITHCAAFREQIVELA